MFFKKKPADDVPLEASDELLRRVREHMPEATSEDAALVGAIAGLFACVAYADRDYSEAEREAVRRELERVHGLTAAGVNAVSELLDQRIAELARESLQTYTRVLYDGTARELRVEVLDVLVDLAAADENLTMDETTLLRRVARGLGLSDEEYNQSQARHRDRLSVLK